MKLQMRRLPLALVNGADITLAGRGGNTARLSGRKFAPVVRRISRPVAPRADVHQAAPVVHTSRTVDLLALHYRGVSLVLACATTVGIYAALLSGFDDLATRGSAASALAQATPTAVIPMAAPAAAPIPATGVRTIELPTVYIVGKRL